MYDYKYLGLTTEQIVPSAVTARKHPVSVYKSVNQHRNMPTTGSTKKTMTATQKHSIYISSGLNCYDSLTHI